MKQHVSVTDWSGLKYEKQIALCDLLRVDINYTVMFQREFVSRLTIGKMIEILGKEFEYFNIRKNTFIPEGVFWEVEANPDFSFEKYELCDVLWQAVKEVL